MMNKHFLKNTAQFLLCTLFIAPLFLAGCSDDPEPTNEEELITAVNVTLTATGQSTVTLSWEDENADGIVDENEINGDTLLAANTAYTATIQLLNGEEDATTEIAEEAEDHIFCFTAAGVNIGVSNRNVDANGLPVGITSTWTTTTASSGTIQIALRHQPGIKTGDCPGVGDTDVNIAFDVTIESPE